MIDLESELNGMLRAKRWSVSLAFLNSDSVRHRLSIRDSEPYYPASLVKVFLLGYVASLMDDQLIKLDVQLDSACRDMIVDSSNDAMGYVLDRVCGTNPGSELSETALQAFADRRKVVSNWYKKNGFSNVRIHNRTFNEAPYGRERQLIYETDLGRNSLNAESCLKFLNDLFFSEIWSPMSREWMLRFLFRKWPLESVSGELNPQGTNFLARDLSASAVLWSKAGWTSEVRHDMAAVRGTNGEVLFIVLMTEGLESDEMLCDAGSQILSYFGLKK